ncbi:MAG TPA: DUF308 domain-containing protein [Candidatus Methylomirabilis sp.]|nr:DUF308 domain-containing protein [Candidatus Methylomirabilis sp.]
MTIALLARHWWVVAVRSGLALLFGLSILFLSRRQLSIIVLVFSIYALLDGIWAIATARMASRRLSEIWPICLEGLVSAALGVTALVWPFVPQGVVSLIAAYGLLTGVLEIIAALRLPPMTAGHWLLGTAGVCSLFLAVAIVLMSHADAGLVAIALGTYAVAFGALMLLAAVRFRLDHARLLTRTAT